MRDADRRPLGRLFCWALLVSMGLWACLTANAAGVSPQSELGTTTVADTVYLADGTPAEGTLIISWPAFLTESGAAVAAGTTNATLGANGALSVALVPNAGGSPAGVYYTVIYQLGPAVAARDIVDPEKFKEGISKIIDGTVECLNASTWAKNNPTVSTVASHS